MSKSKNDDRELQIEIARIQIQHEEAISLYTIFLSVIVSLMLTNVSVYVPLGAATGNPLYYFFSALFNVILGIPLLTITRRMGRSQKQIEKEIQDMKDHFLSKQMPTEANESQVSTSSAQGRNWRRWLRKTENKALVVSIIALCITVGFTALNTYHEWNPPAPRAKLTIYIDYPQFKRATNSTVTDVTVNIRVVNDSPISAKIREWNLSLNYNMTYQILNQVETNGNLTLSPSAQTDFTITTTLEGQNHTVLPDAAIRSIVFTVSYEDNIGLQEATREYGFL